MTKNKAPNDTLINVSDIKITNCGDSSQDSFRWFRSKSYEIVEGNFGMYYDMYSEGNEILDWYIENGLPYPSEDKWKEIKSKSKVIKYEKVNLRDATIELINIDTLNDREIIEFYDKYGPLGLMPYYSLDRSNPILELIFEGHATPNLHYNNYWPAIFNLGNHFELTPEIEFDSSIKFINEFNGLDNKEIYQRYVEPLWLAKYLINEFQLYMRAMLRNPKTLKSFYVKQKGVSASSYNNRNYTDISRNLAYEIENNIKILPQVDDLLNIQFSVPANSLFQAIFIYAVLNNKNIPLAECRNPSCGNLFWREHNRSEYCSDACKSTFNGRKQRELLAEKVSTHIKNEYCDSKLTSNEIHDKEINNIVDLFGKSALDVFNPRRIDRWLDRK